MVNAISRNLGIIKFLFQGAPGTGKTETAKQVARILNRELYAVDFSAVIDSKLGQTQKNIVSLFREITEFAHPEKVIVLFDEIDSIALDRTIRTIYVKWDGLHPHYSKNLIDWMTALFYLQRQIYLTISTRL